MKIKKKELDASEIKEEYNNSDIVLHPISMYEWVMYKGEWIHIVMTYNGSVGKTYINGENCSVTCIIK